MVIEKIWDVYDVDTSNSLDKDEVWAFLEEALATLLSNEKKLTNK